MADSKEKNVIPKQKSILNYFGSPNTQSTPVQDKTKRWICKYCGFKAQKENALRTHELHCKKNPNRIKRETPIVAKEVRTSQNMLFFCVKIHLS